MDTRGRFRILKRHPVGAKAVVINMGKIASGAGMIRDCHSSRFEEFYLVVDGKGWFGVFHEKAPQKATRLGARIRSKPAEAWRVLFSWYTRTIAYTVYDVTN